jgi:hypothetical protein
VPPHEVLACSEVRTLHGGGNVEFVSISADGLRVAAGNWRGRGVHVWTPAAGAQARLFLPEQVNVTAALSPDDELLTTATSERFELWRVEGASACSLSSAGAPSATRRRPWHSAPTSRCSPSRSRTRS